MHRALFWKEWRQLALIRWGGIALGAVLPVAFTAGAEMAQRGLLLDLIATADDDGVDAAARAFVELLRQAQTSAASLPASRST